MSKMTDLRKKFKEINDVFWATEFNNRFLKIELNLTNLNSIADSSRAISKYIDEINLSDDNYFLDIYSSGTEKQIDLKDIEIHINGNVIINLKESIKDKMDFEGTLVSKEKDSIIVRWNNKGRFQKQTINTNNIVTISLSAKITKEKKDEQNK